ncbi:TolB family protein [Mucilaginibacter lutimaris]|uniref:TolB family protein n=1 Tax=Mucilaginibacter lutimaris TaxID=931629 RepID=A0ABW2ZGL6_9SPHI
MKRLLLALLLLLAVTSKAQQFGGNPPSVEWKQVQSPVARVIYPQGLDSVAQRVAQTIAQMNSSIQPTIGFKQRRVSIVLQNQTTISNAYVGLAPFRSEFYLTPGQNSFDVGSLPWSEQLAIHEFRHVQQYNNFRVGLSKVISIPFGEGGQALANALSVPDWFFEGDAVYNETLVSQQGRGRLPYFFNGFRALWAAGKNYSWMKLRNGSYLDYTPNHYPLGYMMVAYGREKYGNDFWRGVTHDAAAFNTGFYPLQGAIKKHAGVNYTAFRDAAFDHFKQVYKDDARATDLKLKNRHFVADEEFPAYINDSTLIYLRTTYNHITKFVIRTGNKERTIATQSINTDNFFSYHNGKIIYAAYRPDLRWGYRNYNELMVLDITTGKERRITRKTKYFSPAFSADGQTIVAVQVAPTGKSELHLLNTNGKLVSVLPNTAGLFYTYPKFYGDDRLVSAVRNQKGEMSLALIDIRSGATSYLLPFSFGPIAFPQVQGEMVYFTKASGLNDELFALSLSNKQLSLLSAPAWGGSIGFYQPAISSNKIAWTSFTASGYQLQQVNLADIQRLPISTAKVFTALPEMNISALKNDRAANFLAAVKPKPLPVTNYSKLHGLFNFHSIFPSLADPNYAIQLVGNNVLNTFDSQVTFTYNRDEGYKSIGYDAAYGAFFPYLLAGADYTFDRRGLYKGNSIYYNETDIHGGLQVPLNFSAGKNIISLSVGSSYYYSRNTFQEAFRTLFKDSYYTYLSNTLRFSNQTQKARQNINPHFAQNLYISYKKSVSGREANQILSTGSLYFPGLSTNHSLVLSGAYQHRGQNNGIGFSNDFPFSYGYNAENLDDMSKFAASYHFPIAYPDGGFGNLLYLMRLRGNIFYEQTHAKALNFYTNGAIFRQDFRSVGGAVFFDTKWFNQGAISFGIRYSRLLDNDFFGGSGRNRVELVLPVSIF